MLTAENISKLYCRKPGKTDCFHAVWPLDLEVRAGELLLVSGRSGSGKTTLLNMLAGLLAPTQGKVRLGGTDLYAMDDGSLSRLRFERMGTVPQGRSAVDTLTVLENILLPARLYGKPAPCAAAREWTEKLGIAHLADVRPAELSGGELRRTAIARALAQEPDILFADEPTGDLDDENTRAVLSALRDYAHERKKAVFVVSHESGAARYADRAYEMDGGKLRCVK